VKQTKDIFELTLGEEATFVFQVVGFIGDRWIEDTQTVEVVDEQARFAELVSHDRGENCLGLAVAKVISNMQNWKACVS